MKLVTCVTASAWIPILAVVLSTLNLTANQGVHGLDRQMAQDRQTVQDRHVAADMSRHPSAEDDPSKDPADRIQPFSQNPHYLEWGGEPVFGLGATGYHSWAPVSRPGTADFIKQMDRLAGVIEEISSPHVRGFMRVLPYDPMNHMHDGPVETVLQPWKRLEDGRYDLRRFEPEWEERFASYLAAALEREIIVAVEI